MFEENNPTLHKKLQNKSDLSDIKLIKEIYNEIYKKVHTKFFLEKLYNSPIFDRNTHIGVIIDYLKNEENDQKLNCSNTSYKELTMKKVKESDIRPINSYEQTKIIFGEDLNSYIESKMESLCDSNGKIHLNFSVLLDFIQNKK